MKLTQFKAIMADIRKNNRRYRIVLPDDKSRSEFTTASNVYIDKAVITSYNMSVVTIIGSSIRIDTYAQNNDITVPITDKTSYNVPFNFATATLTSQVYFPVESVLYVMALDPKIPLKINGVHYYLVPSVKGTPA